MNDDDLDPTAVPSKEDTSKEWFKIDWTTPEKQKEYNEFVNKINPSTGFDRATYEKHPNYNSIRISQLYTLLNQVANSGFVDIRPILRELAELHGFDKAIVADFPTKR